MIKSIAYFLIIFFIFQQLKSQISQIDQNGFNPFCDETLQIHWASKETYSFLEWCPLKSTASKLMIFRLVLATVLLITHVKKQWNRKCQKWDNAFKSQQVQFQKSQKPLHFQRTDFGHFNSYSFKFNSWIRKPIVNRWRTIEFEWIAIEMSEVCAVEREHFLWF